MNTTKKASETPKKKETATSQTSPAIKQDNLLDRVIANITEDQKALDGQNELIENAKSYKAEIASRIRDSKRDLVTFVKYATPEQLKRLEELNIDLENTGQGLNKVAELALEILDKAPKGEMTNQALYNEYVKTFKHPQDAFNYTEFNIKCRSLFNSQRLIRKGPTDAKSSRDHIISINGFRPTSK